MSRRNRGLAFAGIGFEVIALVVAAVTVGGLIDKQYDLKGLGTAGMVVLAMVLWFIHLLQLLKAMNREEPPDSSP